MRSQKTPSAVDSELNTEDANPNPEYLIKSIAEQGYTLETSLADLIDNSIAANATKVEILVGLEKEPFMLFVADNGDGMNETELKLNMQFPSNSPAHLRDKSDLGRFGLGMKTASFAHTRRFTVLSKKKGETEYAARTWDVEYLTKKKKWKILIPSKQEIEDILKNYQYLTTSYLKSFDDFAASTIIVWEGLYKYEQFLSTENKKTAVQQDINEITNEYLSVVFHRFMERASEPLKIRVNNQHVEPFNPFPESEADFRPIMPKHKAIKTDALSMKGFVLPSRSMKEVRAGNSIWTTHSKSLMDMEGIYVYRADRLIRFGGWSGLIKKTPRLQLARLMVEVGNGIDDIIQLNVSKSQITIPYEIKRAFLKYLIELQNEAEKEYINNTITAALVKKGNPSNVEVFLKQFTNKGVAFKINRNFTLIEELSKTLNKSELLKLNVLIRIFQNTINKMKMGNDYESVREIIESEENTESENLYAIRDLLGNGISKDEVIKHFLPLIGLDINTIPLSIKSILNNE